MSGPLTILAVDDCRSTRRYLSTLLNDAGHHVVTAGCARSALRALRDLTPDVILTERALPGGLDGSVLIRLLRRDGRFRDTPVLVVSDRDDPADLAAMDAAGASGWIAKPLRVRTLLGALTAVDAARDKRRAFASSRQVRPSRDLRVDLRSYT
jgi:twitching motility two-component system response regulator PilH